MYLGNNSKPFRASYDTNAHCSVCAKTHHHYFKGISGIRFQLSQTQEYKDERLLENIIPGNTPGEGPPRELVPWDSVLASVINSQRPLQPYSIRVWLLIEIGVIHVVLVLQACIQKFECQINFRPVPE